VQVPSFRASKFKVTNGEFAAFVRSQGYQTRKWWSEEGWGWRTFRNVKWPTFWVLGEWPSCAVVRAVQMLP
jgi:formylglycine-generating enzyme required for sulfatase activity